MAEAHKEVFHKALVGRLGAGRVARDAPLAGLTTFRVGGPADWLVTPRDSEELVDTLRLGHSASVPVTILGGGSNVLISDRGIRGLVLRVKGGAIRQEDERRIRADAGVTINGLVRWTVARGLGGLAAWAGTPGTVGGGIFGNAHFQDWFLGELVEEVRLASREGHIRDVEARAMDFGYDQSRLQRTGEVLLSAVFRVWQGDPADLRSVARRSLAYRKQTQPLESPSAGCIFRNPDPGEARLPSGVAPAAGALIDLAGLKGHGIGGARVSGTHANFIVNEGRATAGEVRALVELCRQAVARKFGVVLQEEIVYLGEWGGR